MSSFPGFLQYFYNLSDTFFDDGFRTSSAYVAFLIWHRLLPFNGTVHHGPDDEFSNLDRHGL